MGKCNKSTTAVDQAKANVFFGYIMSHILAIFDCKFHIRGVISPLNAVFATSMYCMLRSLWKTKMTMIVNKLMAIWKVIKVIQVMSHISQSIIFTPLPT